MDSSSDDEPVAALPIEADDEASAYLLSVRAQAAKAKSGSVALPSGTFTEAVETGAYIPVVSDEAKLLILEEFESLRQLTADVAKSSVWSKEQWQRDLVELRKEPTLDGIGSLYQPQLYSFIEWFADVTELQGTVDLYSSQVLYCALSALEKPLLPGTAAELFRLAKLMEPNRDLPHSKVNLVIIEDYFGQRLEW